MTIQYVYDHITGEKVWATMGDPAATIAQDAFVGSEAHILNHIPEVGAGWASVPNIQTDGIKINGGYLRHLTPYAMNGGPYYVNVSSFLNGYVQAKVYCWNQTPGYRVELFARYNTTTGARIRVYPYSSGYLRVEDVPGGTITTIPCSGSFIKTSQKLKMLLNGASVKIYYWEYAVPSWTLQGEHTTAILTSGKCGFGVLGV